MGGSWEVPRNSLLGVEGLVPAARSVRVPIHTQLLSPSTGAAQSTVILLRSSRPAPEHLRPRCFQPKAHSPS